MNPAKVVIHEIKRSRPVSSASGLPVHVRGFPVASFSTALGMTTKEILGHELVETGLVFLPDSGGGHDAGLSARVARGHLMG